MNHRQSLTLPDKPNLQTCEISVCCVPKLNLQKQTQFSAFSQQNQRLCKKTNPIKPNASAQSASQSLYRVRANPARSAVKEMRKRTQFSKSIDSEAIEL